MLGSTVVLAIAVAALLAAGWRVAGCWTTAPLERAVAAAPLAGAAAIVQALVLGRVGAGGDATALTVAALATWLAVRLLVAAHPGPAWRPAPSRWLLGAATGVLFALVAFMLLHPGIGSDGISYHLPEALGWIARGDTGATPHVAEEFRSGSYPLTDEVFHAWAMAIARSFAPVALWTGAMLALFAVAAWTGLRRLGCGAVVTTCAIAAVLAEPVLVTQINTPGNDLPALAWLTACGALCACAAGARRPALLVPALVAAGLAGGTKTTTVPLALVVLGAALWSLRDGLRAVRLVLAAGTLAAGGVGGVWYVRNLIAHGWFLYPFSSGPFGGDPEPLAIKRIDVTFLARPRASLAGPRLGHYMGDVAGGLALIGGGVATLLSRPRTRLVVGAALATAFAALAWSEAPFTGRADDPLLDLSRYAPRYLLPVFAAGACALALAARTSRPARMVLAAALAWNVARIGLLDGRDVPRAGTLVAGAMAGLAAAWLCGRSARRVRLGALGAAVAMTIVAASAADGWLGHLGRTNVTNAGALERAFAAIPGWSHGTDPVAFVYGMVGPLAGDRLSHPLTLIGAHESCARTLARTRTGWVIVPDIAPALQPLITRPARAPRCLSGLTPLRLGPWLVYRQIAAP